MEPKFSKFESEIQQLLDLNISIKNIVKYYNKPAESIYNAIKRIKKKKKDIKKLERASRGRISKLTPRAIRALNRDITKSPKKTNRRLLNENNLDISTRTLQRVLRSEGWSITTSQKKRILNAERAKIRLKYAKAKLKELNSIDFQKIIFSDESGIQRGHGSRAEFGRKRQKYPLNPKLYCGKSSSKLDLFLYSLLYIT